MKQPSTSRPPWAGLLVAAVTCTAAAAGVGACAIPRDDERDGGVHPDGFADPESGAFHGHHLRENGYPLAECRQCHGSDYGGGAVGVSCNTAGCHSEAQGVEACGTCHDGHSPPSPVTGSHATHPGTCTDCHAVPKNIRTDNHPDGDVDVLLPASAAGPSGLPGWDRASRRCVNTACHGAESPVWGTTPGPLACDACHGAPPQASHARFEVAAAPEGCTPCHTAASSDAHLDGDIDFVEPSCSQCHGKSPDGAPPPALDGSTAPTSRGVGAHRRHLDGTLPDRIGRAVACEVCHAVPAAMRAPGHLDAAAPADVTFVTGSYDAETGSCVVGCHWNRTPGPVWTDTSGAPRACDACHDFPPTKTLTGKPHPLVAPSEEGCTVCHHLSPETHVDGHVNLLP